MATGEEEGHCFVALVCDVESDTDSVLARRLDVGKAGRRGREDWLPLYASRHSVTTEFASDEHSSCEVHP